MAFDIDKETNKVEEMVLDMVKKVYPDSKMLCLVNKGIELVHDDETKEITSEIPRHSILESGYTFLTISSTISSTLLVSLSMSNAIFKYTPFSY